MKDAHAIYWNLFWGLSTSNLNEMIDREYKAGNFEGVKLYCKTLAIKESGISLETFWDKYVVRKTKLKITLDREAL